MRRSHSPAAPPRPRSPPRARACALPGEVQSLRGSKSFGEFRRVSFGVVAAIANGDELRRQQHVILRQRLGRHRELLQHASLALALILELRRANGALADRLLAETIEFAGFHREPNLPSPRGLSLAARICARTASFSAVSDAACFFSRSTSKRSCDSRAAMSRVTPRS